MLTNAIAATRFREERLEAEMPVATDKQVTRAERLIANNPLMRAHNTPLGLQMLALNIPLTRNERLSQEPRTEPRQVRIGNSTEITADDADVEAFVEANPYMTAQDAVIMIAEANGYRTAEALRAVATRVERFARAFQEGVTRFPTHIREKTLMLSFMAKAANLCVARDKARTDAALEAKRAAEATESEA